ncbi:MAG TPA: ROK family protein [Microthrixaceae bacterium]|nr:ROK family protein [Microthrixaceae bacterium]
MPAADPFSRLTVGVDVGGTKILAVVVDDRGDVLGSCQAATPDAAVMLVASIGDAVDSAVVDAGEAAAGIPLVSIGLGLPGFLSLDGVARQAPNLPAAVGLDIGSTLRERFGVPVVVENDANCAAWAAYRLDAPEARSVVAVTFGTGIGGGFVVEGELLRGAHGFASEPGHMIVQADGDQCVCGQQGCWEVMASGRGLGRMARRAATTGRAPGLLEAAGGDPEQIDGRMVTQLARGGDQHAAEILDTYAWWVSVGLVNLVNLLDPDVVVLGGGVVADGEVFMSRVRAAVATHRTFVEGRHTPIRVSSLGPRAGAVGAALLARRVV